MGPLYKGLLDATIKKVAKGARIIIVGAHGSERPPSFDFDQVDYYGGLPLGFTTGDAAPDQELTALVIFLKSAAEYDIVALNKFCIAGENQIQCMRTPRSIEEVDEFFADLKEYCPSFAAAINATIVSPTPTLPKGPDVAAILTQCQEELLSTYDVLEALKDANPQPTDVVSLKVASEHFRDDVAKILRRLGK